MKLKDISALFNINSRTHRTGVIIVEAVVGTELRKHLFELVDHVVTACTGDTVWLKPKQHVDCGVPYGN